MIFGNLIRTIPHKPLRQEAQDAQARRPDGIDGDAVIWFLIAMFLFFGTVGILAAGDLWKHLGLSPRDFYDEISFWLLVLAVGVCAWAAELMWRLK